MAPAPTAPGAPSLLAPGVAPTPQAAALIGQQAPPAAVNATLGFFRIPVFLLSIYQAAGDQYGVPWQVLAAINEVETDYGYDQAVSSAGAVGWMQFMPETWKLFGTDATDSGYADPYNPADAIFAAARYLRAAGAQKDLRGAIFSYNHSAAYVDSVMLRAKLIEVYPQAMIDQLTTLTVGVPPVQGTDTGQPTAQPAAPAPPSGATAASGHASAPASLSPVTPVLRSALTATIAAPGQHTESAAALSPIGSQVTGLTAGSAPAPKATAATTPAGGVVDLHTRGGSDVMAVKDGRVLRAGTSKRLGGYVTLKDAEGDLFTYGHLGRVGTRAPQPVPRTSTAQASGAAPGDGAGVKLAPGAGPLQVRASAAGSLPSLPTLAAASAAAPASVAGAWRVAGTAAPPVSAALRMLGYAEVASVPPASTLAARGLPRFSPPATLGWLPLRAGQTLWAGSVLGQAPASGVVRFSVRPAGASQAIDPRPLLAAWHLRREVIEPSSIAPAPRPTGIAAGGSPTPAAPTSASVTATATPAGGGGSTTAGDAALAAGTTAAGAAAASAVSHRAPAAPLRYDLSTWGQDRVFFLSQARLESEVLADRRVRIYACGRQGIARHRVDGRVLAVIEYLADSGLHPTVSALQCRHDPAIAGKNVSGHASGDGVDISAINGTPIAGHQGPGSVTDFTIRRLLALKGAFVPHQIISLMAYPAAGNTISMASEADHIHVGFRPAGSATSHSAAKPAATARSATAPTPSAAALADLGATPPSPALTESQWQRLMRHLQSNGNPLLVASPTSAATADGGPGPAA